MSPEPPLVLLDACCVINLLATGVAEQILAAVPARFAVSTLVLEDEVLHIAPGSAEESGEEDEQAPDLEPERATPDVQRVDLGPLVQSGLIEVLQLRSENEHATYIGLALDLDDGEAMTAALALHRGGEVATDDRKAIRILEGWTPPVGVRRTSVLVRTWAEGEDVPPARVSEVLRRIERLASFVPPRDDPERDWWRRMVGGGG